MSQPQSIPPHNPWGQRGTAGAVIASELAFKNVVQVFGEVRALDGVTLNIWPGEIVCLLGHSGCGKTTLLRLAAGIERPTSGSIFLDTVEVSGSSRHVPPEERGVGLMFQDYALFPHLTILQNAMFGLVRMAKSEAEAIAKRALTRVGLARHMGAYPHMLSGGEQQRAALARALAPRPGILLMDEPFSNLDGRMRDEVRDGTITLLKEIRGTAVIVTHDPEEALRVADRIILMRAGRIIQEGTGEELYRQPANIFAARFFCELNEIPGIGRGKVVETPLGHFPAPESLGIGEPAVIGIRPQALRLSAPAEGLEARVLNRRFLGETIGLDLAMPGLENPLRVRVPLRDAANAGHIRVGETLSVQFDPRDVLVFAANGA